MPRVEGFSATFLVADADGDQRKHAPVIVTSGVNHSVTVATAATSRFAGVIEEPPRKAGASQPATIQSRGVGRIICGAAVAAGDRLTANGSGKAIPASAGNNYVGIALENGADDEIIDFVLQPGVE